MTDASLELFLRKWFCGPLNKCFRVREFGFTLDPLKSEVVRFHRGPYSLEGFLLEFRRLVEEGDRWRKKKRDGNKRDWFRNLNAFLGIASYDDDDLNNPIYDALHYDLDCEEDPSKALSVAIEWVRKLKDVYGCDAVIYTTGFKGVHVVIPLKVPTDWEGYELTYRTLPGLSREAKALNDWDMLHDNQLDRIPFTWNYKVVGGVPRRAYVRVITLDGKPLKPEDFDWSLYEPLDLRNVEVVKVVADVPKPKVARPRRGNGKAWAWVEEVIRMGLPDGRHRFILYTLTPYLATIKQVSEEEALEIVKEFLEASCRNHNNCGKVYDSWIRSALRGAKRKGIKPRSLKSWGEKDPEVLKPIKAVLMKGSKGVESTGLNPYAAKVLEFVEETGLEEFSYNDFKRWLEGREGRLLNASEWQGWERRLRQLVSEGLLSRKYLVNGVWVDYGTKQVTTPPSKTVRFYVVH